MKFDKKTILFTAVSVLCSAIFALFAMLPFPSFSAYSAKAWMKNLPDTANVCELSIPGTHDSGATHSIFDVSGKCQDISIERQLNLGVRFFDLRLQLVNDRHTIVHSFVKQNLTLSSVLKDFKKFLTKYPSEFLIVSIKQEADAENSKKGFEEALLKALSPYESLTDYATALPQTVAEARGKIFFISRYQNASIGVPAYSGWRDSATFDLGELHVQDNYCVTDLQVKKTDILDTFSYSQTNRSKLVLNFTSCYLDGAFPPTYAGTSAKTINPWLIKTIKDTNGPLGVVITDFISEKLAKSIYGRNFQ